MNILIVGLGSIAKKHVEALLALQVDCNIYALRSNLSASSEPGIINIYDLSAEKIAFDFAIISNPTHLHHITIKRLAQERIPLFIEKPALHSLIDAAQLIKLVERNNVLSYVACNMRFHPCIQYLRERILKNSSNINEVNIYCGSYLPDWRPGVDFRKVYSANADMGGGVHLDLFHEVDYTIWLFGMPRKSRAYLKNSSDLKIDAIDYANYLFEYDTFAASIILNYYRRKPKRQIEIVFENETLTIDLINNCVKDDAHRIIFSDEKFKLKDTYLEQLRYFISFLNNNRQPFNSLKESVEILKVVLHDEQ